MTENGESTADRITSTKKGTPGLEPGEESRHPVIERICQMGFGVLAVGICLQALAAATALAVAVGLIALGITGGSGLGALIVSGGVIVGAGVAATACRTRAGRLEASGS